MSKLSRANEHGLWSVPCIVEYDQASGSLEVDRKALPRVSERIIFRREIGAEHLACAIRNRHLPASVLIVVGASSSKSPQVRKLVEGLPSVKGSAGPDMHLLEVRGHADHEIIRAGINTARKVRATLIVAVGGGTTLDVGKAVAGLAFQDDGSNIAAFQLKEKAIDPERTLPWIAIPTTSGTGSESSNNAVVELGNEKRSIRPISPPSMIIADPSMTDSLPFRPTVVAAIDALAQALEILTSAKASKEVQAVALAAFLNLAEGIKRLRRTAKSPSARPQEPSETGSQLEPADIGVGTRNLLCWGSLLMGIAFAHANLGLPHALVHHCMRYGLSHGNMVGILLAPGLATQASVDRETAIRLHLAQKAVLATEQSESIQLDAEEDVAFGLEGHMPDQLIAWLRDLINQLFTAAGLPTSLRSAGLTRRDLDWIAASELRSGASFGIPNRPATCSELLEVLDGAF